MGWADDINAIAAGDVHELPKEKATIIPPREQGNSPAFSPQGIKETAEYSAKAGAESFWTMVGQDANAGVELYHDGVPTPLNYLKAAMKVALPQDIVDTIFGASKDFYKGITRAMLPKAVWPDSVKEAGTPEEFVKTYGKKPDLAEEAPKRMVGDIGKPPNAVAKYLTGPLARGVGVYAGLPIGGAGSVSKNLLMSMGSSELSEIGGDIGGGIGRFAGGEKGEVFGRGIGALGGGALGGQANITRVAAMGRGTAAATKAIRNVVPAIRAASTKVEGDTRSFFTRFTDNYKDLSSVTRGYQDQVVAEQYASAIAKMPGARENLEKMQKIAGDLGIDITKFNPGQQTMVPSLVDEVSFFQPKDETQAARVHAQKKGAGEEIIKAYERTTGAKPKTKVEDVQLSLNRTRYNILNEIEARGREAQVVMDESPRMTPEQSVDNGALVKDAFMTEHKDASAYYNRLYQGVYRAADSANVRIKVDDTTAAALNKLSSVEVGMEPQAGYDLQHAVAVAKGRLNNLSFKEAHDIVKSLGREANDARVSGDATKARILSDYRTRLLKDMQEQTFGKGKEPGPARYIWQQFEGINQSYKDNFIPRFETGVNYNLDREAGRSKNNLGYYKDEEVFNKGYLAKVDGRVSETNMKQFDDAFGGKIPGTKKNPDAYKALSRAVEDEYAHDVYGPKGVDGRRIFSEDKHLKFMDSHAAALDRVPELGAKLEAQAKKLLDLKNRAELSAEKWAAITNSPLTKTLGKPQSDKLIAEALSDTKKMAVLIKATGGKDKQTLFKDIMSRAAPWKEVEGGIEYDPTELLKTIEAGSGPAGQGMSSLQLLSRATFGTVEGDKHFNNLKNIAALAVRESLTNPKFSGAGAMVSQKFLTELTGQSAASWISARKSMMEGRTSGTWFITQAAGRFLRVHFQKALQEAQYRALFDPRYSEAVLELSRKPMGQPITEKTAIALRDAAGKEGKALFDELVNRGYVASQTARGAQLGLTLEAQRRKREEARE